MKYIMTLVMATALFFAGCANAPQFTPAMGAAAVRLSVAAGVTLTLRNNPKYIPVASAIAAGIDAAISSNPTLTLDGITNYITSVCQKNNVPPEDTAIFVGLGQMIYNAYVTTYKPTVISSADPNVLLYVNAFKDGLGDAVLALQVVKK